MSILSSLRAHLAWPIMLGCLCLWANSANAHFVETITTLSGASANPPNGSLGTGTGSVILDLDEIKMQVKLNFSGLTGTVTSASLNGATGQVLAGNAGVMTNLTTIPTSVTAGTYDVTFDLTVAASYNAGFITSSGGTISNALNALIFAVENQQAYLQVNTTAFPNGEVRGYLAIAPVPEPASLAVLGLSAVGLIRNRRRLVSRWLQRSAS